MKHLGDITKINGGEIPVVDVITGGSPCQDLSVAGKRAGLEGERSGLFMEQIRIIKEMREHDRRDGRTDELIRPRWFVWENVQGAFSSNGGKDFQTVLSEIVRIVKPDAPDVPLPDRGGWSKSGCVMGYGSDGCPFSIAWRLHDAQFWGAPQRRKRIALVADFAGLCSPEILFERKGNFGDKEKSFEKWKNYTSKDAIAFSSSSFGGWIEDDVSQTIRASGGDYGGGSETLIAENDGLRRKTPLETERCFSFPDGWTDIGEWTDSKGKRHRLSDAQRYRALGNSIVTDFWFYLLRRISAQYERIATLGSLFDGIGGFPYCWERCNGKGTAIWASEIEEFQIAVTKYHFPE